MLISRRPKLSKLRPPQVSLFSHLAHLIRNIHRKREREREREARANGANNVSSHDDLSAAPLLQH